MFQKAEIPKFLVFSTKKVGVEIFGSLSSGIVASQAQNRSKMDPKRYIRLLGVIWCVWELHTVQPLTVLASGIDGALGGDVPGCNKLCNKFLLQKLLHHTVPFQRMVSHDRSLI